MRSSECGAEEVLFNSALRTPNSAFDLCRYVAELTICRCIRFSSPAAVHQFAGEIIEQLGMRRLDAGVAEVAGRCDDAAAEMMLPQSIHGDASRQRILAARDPAGER